LRTNRPDAFEPPLVDWPSARSFLGALRGGESSSVIVLCPGHAADEGKGNTGSGWNPEKCSFSVQARDVYHPARECRADLVCFVNGLPLVFIELKAVYKNIRAGFESNLRDYMDENVVAHAFHHNAFLVVSNGHRARYGSITSRWEHFAEWKRDDEKDRGSVEAEFLLDGMLAHDRLLDIVENFILFDESKAGATRKVVARNHQLLGVDKITCARMHQMIVPRWQAKAAAVWMQVEAKRIDAAACADDNRRSALVEQAERLQQQAVWLDETLIEIVVSEAQNEVEDFAEWAFDIIPHRELIKKGFETADGKCVEVERPSRTLSIPSGSRLSVQCG
jgi:hypothetical protein